MYIGIQRMMKKIQKNTEIISKNTGEATVKFYISYTIVNLTLLNI
jgi:hypothetical protein